MGRIVWAEESRAEMVLGRNDPEPIIDAGTLQCNTVLIHVIGSLIGSSQSASQLDGQNSARQAETLIGAEPHVGHSQ